MQFTLFATVAALATAAVAAPSKRSHTGTATWFTQNGNPGSCGQYHADSDYIVAVSGAHHSSDNCNKQVSTRCDPHMSILSTPVADPF